MRSGHPDACVAHIPVVQPPNCASYAQSASPRSSRPAPFGERGGHPRGDTLTIRPPAARVTSLCYRASAFHYD